MAYSPFNLNEIDSGSANTEDLWLKIKGNDEDHEARIVSLEGGSSVVYPPMVWSVRGLYGINGFGARTGVIFTTVNFNLTITGIRLIILEAGTAGTTEIDVQKKSGVNPYVSLFSTLPSVGFGSGDYFSSTNQVLDAGEVNLLAGDFLRLDITSVQTDPDGFLVRIDYEKS